MSPCAWCGGFYALPASLHPCGVIHIGGAGRRIRYVRSRGLGGHLGFIRHRKGCRPT